MRRSFLVALTAGLLATPAIADTVITNANGIQVDASGKLQHFTGLVIGRDGKVVRLLHAGDAEPKVSTVIDEHGKVLLPGLIDAHGHLMQLGQLTVQLDLKGVGSLAEMQQQLRRYAAEHPGSGWILGRGWNEELWPDKRPPTASDLDSVVSDRPVWLYRVDGHAALANSMAMRLMGINKNTKAPAGGEIVQGREGPTGLLLDNARELVEAKLPAATPGEADAMLLSAQQILLSDGITTIDNMRTPPEDWQSLDRLGRRGRLHLRVIAYAYGPNAVANAAAATRWRYDDHLRMAGIKLYADGALGSRGAWLKQPYADAPQTRGLSLHSDSEMRALANSAAAAGLQVAIHAIGDAANAQAIGTFEILTRKYGRSRRWRLEHAQILDPADIPRIARAGIVASMQPVHATSDRLMAEARLGPDRLVGAYAWRSVLRSGAHLAFGSDFPFDTPNPFVGMSAAISRQDIHGEPPGGWLPLQKLTLAEALNAYTRGAAYAGFAEAKIGALEPNKWADFIVIDRDPTKVDPQQLARSEVLETWIGGKKIWSREANAAGGPPERGK